MSAEWYDVVDGPGLEQGDVLLGYPIYRVIAAADGASDEVQIEESIVDVVVLTQSCDIENRKVEEILLAALVSYQSIREDPHSTDFMKSSDFRKQAVQGALPAQALLPLRKEAPVLPWSLADFHHLYSTPLRIADSFTAAAGPRLRLNPPYKEHLAQAFARYIMRVGLPTTLHDFTRLK